MLALRKHKHRRETRKIKHFSTRPRVRSLVAWRRAHDIADNDPRYHRNSRRLYWLFHDAPTRVYQKNFLADPVTHLMKAGYSDAEVFDAISEGVPVNNAVLRDSRVSKRVSTLKRSPLRLPNNDVLLPPSPAVVPTGARAEHLSFLLPKSVMVCVRRKQRRQVLLALGRGGAGNKPPHWSDESYLRC